VDRAVDAAAAGERRVRGVDDDVAAGARDVPDDRGDARDGEVLGRGERDVAAEQQRVAQPGQQARRPAGGGAVR
jgi:hypothetical protein